MLERQHGGCSMRAGHPAVLSCSHTFSKSWPLSTEHARAAKEAVQQASLMRALLVQSKGQQSLPGASKGETCPAESAGCTRGRTAGGRSAGRSPASRRLP